MQRSRFMDARYWHEIVLFEGRTSDKIVFAAESLAGTLASCEWASNSFVFSPANSARTHPRHGCPGVPGEDFKCPWQPLIKMHGTVKPKVEKLAPNSELLGTRAMRSMRHIEAHPVTNPIPIWSNWFYPPNSSNNSILKMVFTYRLPIAS
jgi:hypothetical protein